jgi:hypothetical protein
MRIRSFHGMALARPVLLAMTAFTVAMAVRAVGETRTRPREDPIARVAHGDPGETGAPGACEDDAGDGQEMLHLPPGHPPLDAMHALPPGHPPIAPPIPRGHPVPTVDGPGRAMPVFPQDGTSTI